MYLYNILDKRVTEAILLAIQVTRPPHRHPQRHRDSDRRHFNNPGLTEVREPTRVRAASHRCRRTFEGYLRQI